MNTFKRITTKVVTALALSTAFFAHNVQAAPTDAVCVALGKWGGAVVELKQLGMSEEEQMKNNVHGVKNKVAKATMARVIRYVYIDDGKYVDARYIYLKCKIGDFD